MTIRDLLFGLNLEHCILFTEHDGRARCDVEKKKSELNTSNLQVYWYDFKVYGAVAFFL